jgi:plastin-1
MIPNTLDVRVINFKIQVKPRDQIENWNLCVNSGRAVGCRMNDIDTKELVKGHKEMLLKVIWQVIKVGLETKMKKNQNLIKKFMDSSDDMENMVRLASDKLILKWVRDIK